MPVINFDLDDDIIVNADEVIVESEATTLNNSVADNSLTFQAEEDLNISHTGSNADLDTSLKSVCEADNNANSSGSLSPIDRIKSAIGKRFPRINYTE